MHPENLLQADRRSAQASDLLTVIPQIVRRISDERADSLAFLSAYAEQLRCIIDHLSGAPEG